MWSFFPNRLAARDVVTRQEFAEDSSVSEVLCDGMMRDLRSAQAEFEQRMDEYRVIMEGYKVDCDLHAQRMILTSVFCIVIVVLVISVTQYVLFCCQMKTTKATHDRKVEDLKVHVNDAAAHLEDLKEHVAGIDQKVSDKVSDTETGIHNMSKTIDEVVFSLATYMDALRQQIIDIEKGLAARVYTKDTANCEMVRINDAHNKLQMEVEHINEVIAHNMTVEDKLKIDMELDHLRKQIDALMVDCIQLPLPPATPPQ